MEVDVVDIVVEWIQNAQKMVVLTGPELSAESGLPDFSDPRLNPHIRDFREDRNIKAAYWSKIRDTYPVLAQAEPSLAHQALVELELLGNLDCIFTQTTDGLHHKAGSTNVIELHSSLQWVTCTNCGKDYSMNEILDLLDSGIEVPECRECGGDQLKPPISFPGQPLPHWEVREAWIRLHHSDLFLVVGATLDAEPVASFPFLAKENECKVVIISEKPSDADDYVDAVIYGKPSLVLPHIAKKVKEGITVT